MNGRCTRIAVIVMTLLVSACATTKPPGTEVTRFHLGNALPAQPVTIEPADPSDADSIQFTTYAGLVAAELSRLGYSVSDTDDANLVALVAVTRGLQQKAPKRSPFSIGIGGGSYGGNVGIGGGVNMPVGGSSGGEVFVNALEVKLKDRAENAIVWEGRAVRETESGEGSAVAAVQSLAAAPFAEFPGESGKTVTVE